ncbi:hypothetical protein DFR67_12034 [Williamsia limnetica]|uniref:Uncharacterized protein n=1 Tax=Williamsia limnetica TaxID=882452 RepID=A0A318RD18_WILLI|nr:hypothetical protein DFR67_12034 [Williamsia limnetica]
MAEKNSSSKKKRLAIKEKRDQKRAVAERTIVRRRKNA